MPDAGPAATEPRPDGFDEPHLLGANAPSIDLSRIALPPPLRVAADFGVLDLSEYFAETSGGVRTYLLQKARYVEARPSLRQVLVLPGDRDAVADLDGVRCYRLHGPLIPLQRTYRFMLATRSLARICAHERPNVIEVGSAYAAPWIVRRATDQLAVPAVWFYHAHLPRLVNARGADGSLPRRLAGAAVQSYVRAIAKTVRMTIASSEHVVQQLRAWGVERVAKVPLGVDVDHFHPSRAVRRAAVRARLGLPEGRIALYVGRFSREKNVHVMLRGWHDVAHRTGATLVLVGVGPREVRFRQMAGTNVVFLPFEGDRDRLADLYAAVDLCITPGPNETFGLAALEAMASGIPVLAADQGGVAESVSLSGAGRCYAAHDAGHFAECAVQMLAEDLPRLGRTGRAYVETHHRWSMVFDRLFDVYRDVAAG